MTKALRCATRMRRAVVWLPLGWVLRFSHYPEARNWDCSERSTGCVSHLTPEPPQERVAGLTFNTVRDAPVAMPELEPSDSARRRTDAWLSMAVIACVGLVWLYFTS